MRDEAEKLHYRYEALPPYEVFSNDFLSFDEILVLRNMEEIISRYKNSGAFPSLDYAIAHFFASPFIFLKEYERYLSKNGVDLKNKSRRFLFDLLYVFLETHKKDEIAFEEFALLFAMDYIKDTRLPPPAYLKGEDDGDFRKNAPRFCPTRRGWTSFLPHSKEENFAERKKHVKFYAAGKHARHILLFDERQDTIEEITPFF